MEGIALKGEHRRRIKRRKFKKELVRVIRNIALYPAKMPRIPLQAVDQAMRVCEVTGVLFIVLMIASMLKSRGLLTTLCILDAFVFFSLLFFIKLKDYQEILEEIL